MADAVLPIAQVPSISPHHQAYSFLVGYVYATRHLVSLRLFPASPMHRWISLENEAKSVYLVSGPYVSVVILFCLCLHKDARRIGDVH